MPEQLGTKLGKYQRHSHSMGGTPAGKIKKDHGKDLSKSQNDVYTSSDKKRLKFWGKCAEGLAGEYFPGAVVGVSQMCLFMEKKARVFQGGYG
jgi:hypothetical protein